MTTTRLPTFPIREVLVATPRSRIVRLDTTGAEFAFRAGQSVLAGSPRQPRRKPYSIACSPEEAARHRWLELLIQVGADSSAGPHLNDLWPEAPVEISGPMGTFQFPVRPVERRFLFIAGGTGVAPLRSMLFHVLEALSAPEPQIGFVYSARAPDEFAYAGELERLAQEGRLRLTRTVTRTADHAWDGERGRIDLRHLALMVPDPATLCFICGPPTLLKEMPPLLRQLGVAEQRIRMEEWEA